MKFLSLKNPKVITFLLNGVLGVLGLLVIYTIAILMLLQFIVPSSFILIIYDVLLIFMLMYGNCMPDRYWEWLEQGYNEYKVKIIFILIYLSYSAVVAFVYWDELQPFVPERFK